MIKTLPLSSETVKLSKNKENKNYGIVIIMNNYS